MGLSRSNCERTSPAYEYLAGLHKRKLERLQRAGVPYPPLNSEENWNAARAMCLDVLGELAGREAAQDLVACAEAKRIELCKRASTPYRIPLEFWVLSLCQARIRRALRTLRLHPGAAHQARSLNLWGMEEILDPIVDSYPDDRANAYCKAFADSNEAVIVVQWGLTSFNNLVCKSLAATWDVLKKELPTDQDGFSLDKFSQSLVNSESFRFFADIVEAYYFHGTPVAVGSRHLTKKDLDGLSRGRVPHNGEGSARWFPLPTDLHELAHQMETSMDLFVLGHEFGHLLLEHLPRARGDESHRQEFAADELGLQLMFEAKMVQEQLPDLVLPYLGAYLFLRVREILERGAYLMATGSAVIPASDTHPPLPKRAERLRQFLPTIGNQRAPLIVAQSFDFILSEYWKHLEERLMEERHAGRRLHPVWTCA